MTTLALFQITGHHNTNEAPERLPLTFQSLQYPPVAKAAVIEGAVALRVTVGELGTVEDVVAMTGPSLLVDAATSSMRTWSFRPGSKRMVEYSYLFEIDGYCSKEPTPTLVRMRPPYNVVKVTSCRGWPE